MPTVLLDVLSFNILVIRHHAKTVAELPFVKRESNAQPFKLEPVTCLPRVVRFSSREMSENNAAYLAALNVLRALESERREQGRLSRLVSLRHLKGLANKFRFIFSRK